VFVEVEVGEDVGCRQGEDGGGGELLISWLVLRMRTNARRRLHVI
jgi:hypothetical protein